MSAVGSVQPGRFEGGEQTGFDGSDALVVDRAVLLKATERGAGRRSHANEVSV